MTSQEFSKITGVLLFEGKELKIYRGQDEDAEVIDYRVEFVDDSSGIIGLIDEQGEKETLPIRFLPRRVVY